VRETLFNWLQARIPGARCLDLFAGSGALGLEALSRGAARVVFVERDPAAARELQARLVEWGAGPGEAAVERRDALQYLAGPPEPFDVVFLDPPFAAGLLGSAAEALRSGGWLAPGARIYVEHALRDGLPPLSPDWKPFREGRAGEVGYHLLETGERAR